MNRFHVVPFLVLLFPSSLTYAQSGDTLWTHVRDLVRDRDERIINLCETSDGSILAGVRAENHLTGSPKVVKLSADGSFQWIHNYINEIHRGHLCGIVVRPDDGFNMVSFTNDDRVQFVRCDANGTPVDSTFHAIPGFMYFTSDICASPDGGLALVMRPRFGDTVLMRFSATGDTMWTRYLDLRTGGRGRPLDVEFSPGSEDAFVLLVRYGGQHAYVYSYNLQGDYLWRRSLYWWGFREFYAYGCVIPLGNGRTIVTGESRYMVIEENGSAEPPVRWTSNHGVGIEKGVRDDQGRFIFAGFVDQYHPNSGGFLMGVDFAHHNHWIVKPDLGSWMFYRTLLTTSDGRVIAAGGAFEGDSTPRSVIVAFRGFAEYQEPEIDIHSTRTSIPSTGAHVPISCTMSTPETMDFSCHLRVNVLQPGSSPPGRLLYEQDVVLHPDDPLLIENHVHLPASLPAGECRIIGTLVDSWGEEIVSDEFVIIKRQPGAPGGVGVD